MSNNKIVLTGNLGADAQEKVFSETSKVVNIRLATNEKWTDKAGAAQEETSWHTVEAWGKNADLAKVFKKGDLVTVTGSLKYKETTKDGATYDKAIIKISHIEKAEFKAKEAEAK